MKKVIVLGLIIAACTAFGFASRNQEINHDSTQQAQVITGADKQGYSESNMDSW
ncbi:MAG: hypothetical protein KDC93_01235 [Cyclobacteriaceae bacterium]|jgi:hypothetical protein|nr:hypothetical protein [Cyclobacteriaceae bacterium]